MNNFKSGRCPITNEVAPNSTLSKKDYHISYNPSAAHYGTNTTAIILDDRVFLILSGDHRNGLSTEGSDIGTCLDYFISNIHLANPFSEHLMAVGLKKDPFKLAPTALKSFGQEGVDKLKAACVALAEPVEDKA